MNKIPQDFDWRFYTSYYIDLRKAGINTESKAIQHYIRFGSKEERIYNRNMIKSKILVLNDPLQKKIIFLSDDDIGDFSKYTSNILDHMDICLHNYIEFDIITNNQKYNNHQYIKNIKGLEILQLLKSQNFNDLILHINIFTGIFYNYTVDEIFDLLSNIKANNKKIIITVHNFFWIDNKNFGLPGNISSYEQLIMEPTSDIDSLNRLFMLVDLIIFPTGKIKDIYLKKGLNINKINYIVQQHNDIYYKDIKPHYQQTEDTIRIIYIRSIDIFKNNDSDLIEALIEYNTKSNMIDKKLEFHLIGFDKTIKIVNNENTKIKIIYYREYNDSNIFRLLNNIGPHLFVLPIYYGAWSYLCSIVLKTGLPIFYNQDIYYERLLYRDRTNIYPYNSSDTTIMIINKFNECLNDMIIKSGIPYIRSEENPNLYIHGFYENIYGRDLKINRYEVEIISKYLDNKDNYMKIHEKIKPFAIYFPQFHKVEENDINYYPGYTDMINLRTLKRNKNSDSSHILTPLNDWVGYYDLLLDEEIINRQVLTAKAYGIYGFAIYNYWFTNNKLFPERNKVMYKVTEKIFRANYDFNIFFIWPNYDWNSNLYNSTENLNKYTDYFYELLPYFQNKNYYKVNNKPVFGIMNYIKDHNKLSIIISMWDRLCIEQHFDGIYIFFVCDANTPFYQSANGYYINAPFWKGSSLFGSVQIKNDVNIVDYKNYLPKWEKDIILPKVPLYKDVILNIFPGFDNTVRNLYKNNHTASIKTHRYINNDTENFKIYFGKILDFYLECKNDTKILLINAWNEWGENMSIEPSNEKRFEYLEIIQDFFLNL